MRTIFFSLSFLFICSAVRAQPQPWDNAKYTDTEVLGWKVKINQELFRGDTSVLNNTLALIREELLNISLSVPFRALGFLKSIPFWIEKEAAGRGMIGQYWRRGSEAYLMQKGIDPAKAESIVLIAAPYIRARMILQDWVILHEMAHAYHFLMISDDSPIRKAYEHAKREKLYQNVPQGQFTRHHGYAVKNYREYFAEISTMYFGHASYYPYDKNDLKQYDPIGYQLVEALWKVNQQ